MAERNLTSFHVRRAIAGDEQSVSWMVSRLTPVLEAQAAYRIGPILRRFVDPGDLVDEVWMVALPRLVDIQERGGRCAPVLMKFLSSVLLKKVNGLLRKHRRGALELHDDAGLLADVPASLTSAMGAARRSEDARLVREALERLDEKDREVLILRGLEQWPNQTVAELLGEAPNTVTVRYRRALEKLRKALPDSVFEEMGDE